MGIECPTGPYSLEMTMGPAWPWADEDAYRDRAAELRTTLAGLTATCQQWEQQRAQLFLDGQTWSGDAATAAAAEIDLRIAAMHTLQDQLRTAATNAEHAATVITNVKTGVTDNVHTAQNIIAQIEDLPDATGAEKSNLIIQIIAAARSANVAAVAAGAAQLGAREAAATSEYPDEKSMAPTHSPAHGGGVGKFKTAGPFGRDTPILPVDPETPTANLIGGAAEGTPAGLPATLLPDKTDWILGGAGATAQTFTDRIAELTRRGLATGGDGASPTLKKAVEEIKNPFTFLGKDTPALGSKIGGGVGAIMSIPSIAKDVGEGKMSAGQAITREGVGLVAGTLVAGPATALAGPVGGAVAGIVIGNLASKGVDAAWVPLSKAQETFTNAGGPGAAMKAARWGR